MIEDGRKRSVMKNPPSAGVFTLHKKTEIGEEAASADLKKKEPDSFSMCNISVRTDSQAYLR